MPLPSRFGLLSRLHVPTLGYFSFFSLVISDSIAAPGFFYKINHKDCIKEENNRQTAFSV